MISFELTCFNQIYASKVAFIAKRNVKVWDECVSLGTPIWLFNWFCGFGKLANQLISQLILDHAGNEPTRRYADV